MTTTAQPGASVPAIEFVNVSKEYKGAERKAVDGISFTVAPETFLAILGPNGAGKTTLIGMLTTALRPTAGEVRVSGFDTMRGAREVRKRLGLVPQKSCLDPKLSVEEHLRIHASLYGIATFHLSFRAMSAEYRKTVGELAKVLGLENHLQAKVGSLSGGYQRRVEIARALLTSPQVLIMDEPSVALDPDSRQQLWDVVRAARERYQPTLVVTTHYLAEVEAADRIIIVSKGKIIADARPTDLRAKYSTPTMVVDSVDTLTLRMDLERAGVRYEGKGPYRVVLGNLTAHELIQQLQVRLTSLEVHTPTLEEAYARLVGLRDTDAA